MLKEEKEISEYNTYPDMDLSFWLHPGPPPTFWMICNRFVYLRHAEEIVCSPSHSHAHTLYAFTLSLSLSLTI